MGRGTWNTAAATVLVIGLLLCPISSYAANAGRAEHTPGEVPVGGITMYGGTEADLPANWKICNGDVVVDPLSPFHGKRVPDLRGSFVRGAEAPTELSQRGGIERVASHSHTVDIDSHSHTVDIDIDMEVDSLKEFLWVPRLCGDFDQDGDCDEFLHGFFASLHWGAQKINYDVDMNRGVLGVYLDDSGGATDVSHSHVGSVSGSTGRSSVIRTGTDDSSDNRPPDNRPPFVNVHYIIRIR